MKLIILIFFWWLVIFIPTTKRTGIVFFEQLVNTFDMKRMLTDQFALCIDVEANCTSLINFDVG